jgi:hypothetical protein
MVRRLPVPRDAKADADIIAVRPLLDLPNVTLLVNAVAERIETDPAGRLSRAWK